MVAGISSAGGVIALLDDDNDKVKEYALTRLNGLVADHWPEISESISKLEILSEDRKFSQHELASLVVSKVYYNLGSYDDSLTYALGAGQLFDVNGSSEYIETIISKCIDRYTAQRVLEAEQADKGEMCGEIDERLAQVVDRMFERCLSRGKMHQAIGIALETRRLDVLERAVLESGEHAAMIEHCFNVAITLVESRRFLKEVLKHLAKLYSLLPKPDYLNMCHCYIFLNDPQAVADILEKLITSADDIHVGRVTAYQISFDLYQSASQQFLGRVMGALRSDSVAAVTEEAVTMEERPEGNEQASTTESTAASEDQMEVDVDTVKESEEKDSSSKAPTEEDELTKARNQLLSILDGDRTIEMDMQFLIRTNHSDLLLLRQIKEKVHNSICHTATIISNSFMHCGTTSDTFLREDLDWLGQASNWAKFSATASLGVIHKGHEKEALSLMATYLPKDSTNTAGYQDGGGLYALGLIHANHGKKVTEYLLQQLRGASNEVVRHGACLGLGLAAMGTARTDIYEDLKSCLFSDDAVAGEAAAIAMGLVMVGSFNATAIDEMVKYAHQTQHEKIIRGLSIGIALTAYGWQEEADSLIENLVLDKDPILRRSGMFAIAMAYVGTGNNRAIQRLLHVGVSDANDDVRRAAVTSIGFLLIQSPEQCPSVVSLLSESFNPHVRCGSAMALGIACAGSGSKEAMAIIEPMWKDSVNYVRQGAFIAGAMVMVAQSPGSNAKVAPFRETLRKVISNSHEDSMSKFGAILAQGIVNAGGQNATISLQSCTGRVHMASVVGALAFQNFWFWFPLSHFLSLSFRPSAIIALNQDLGMPAVEFKSSAKPSTYAYPPQVEAPKEKEKEKVATAVLSTTAKAKAKEAKKKAAGGAGSETPMDVDPPTGEVKSGDDIKKEDDKKFDDEDKEDEKKAAKEPEPDFEMLKNPARVLRAQLDVLSLDEGLRYKPVKPLSSGGIILLKDMERASGQEESLVAPVPAGGPVLDDGPEPEPPEPFEWTP